jgi:hypothetical protein
VAVACESGADPHSGFAVVSGRVSKVQRNRGGIWIELQGSVLRLHPICRTIRRGRLQGSRAAGRGAWLGAGPFAARRVQAGSRAGCCR